MRNIKDQVYAQLVEQFGEDHVTDQYPTDWTNLPAIQYTEEDNRVAKRTNEGETKSYVRYRIDIWDSRSTSESALKVDAALGIPMDEETSFGLSRTSCSDISDPTSGLKHKQMRYEAIIDMQNNLIYWN